MNLLLFYKIWFKDETKIYFTRMFYHETLKEIVKVEFIRYFTSPLFPFSLTKENPLRVFVFLTTGKSKN